MKPSINCVMQGFATGFGVTVDDARNGVLWCDAVEAAFEAWALCIEFDQQQYRFLLVDESWRPRKLKDNTNCRHPAYFGALKEMTYGWVNCTFFCFCLSYPLCNVHQPPIAERIHSILSLVRSLQALARGGV